MKLLTFTGSLAAFAIGLSIYIGFGWNGLIVLGIFFASSSLWSKYKKEKKQSLEKIVEKGDQRDSFQVLANGGIPAIMAICSFIYYDVAPWESLFAVAIASANADTWASEIGTLSKRKPRLLWSFKEVDIGTSGAVTMLGTLAAFYGASLIGIAFYMLFTQDVIVLFTVILFGFIGSLLDTVLGSTLQVKYRCKVCRIKTEKKVHCNNRAQKIHGLSFMNNDGVNFLSITLATLLSYLFYILIF
ncbi:uncharacterized protein (TIGR00297 family) [Bacillus alveayuensis]|uniref:Uncharacterized protein (TIGR00297 family) n=1 Tax=Aeribacillus alveayuensis TaxID=279215 RepID=A0ABT9VKA9_9BACI|nr:uncharacterized protein (TIGR00297 family) [Bacillus alveayuensis]